jgi:hypothetical protein
MIEKKIKQRIVRLMVGAAALLFSADAMAANPTVVTANIAFDSPLTLTKTSDINFGTVLAGVTSTYTITTAGTVTASGSGQWLYGTKSAANISIGGSTTSMINITIAGYTASNGVTPSNATCSYGGGAAAPCTTITSAAAPGAGKTLLIGLDAAVDGTQTAGV